MLASGKIKNSVKEILTNCGITGPPIDLRIVAEHFGLRYVETNNLPDNVEALILSKGSHVDAVINKDASEIHCRFSLAHQLYHYKFEGYLFIPEGRVRLPDPQDGANISAGRSRSEVLADMFATELLLPIYFLQKHYRSGLAEVDVPGVFRVSKLVADLAISSQYNLIQIGSEKFSS